MVCLWILTAATIALACHLEAIRRECFTANVVVVVSSFPMHLNESRIQGLIVLFSHSFKKLSVPRSLPYCK